MIKEITVFTNGESSEISTWSNVPFFFTETLIKKGIKVNRVNIYSASKIESFFNKYPVKLLNKIYKGNTYNYFRSLIHYYKTRKKIKEAIRKYPNSDVLLFLTFSFSAADLTNKKIIQFGDWTYDYYFKYFKNRKPNYFEQASILRENRQIEGSNLCISLFPAITTYMESQYTTPIIHLGNVINALFPPNKEEILKQKKQSKTILFVGSMKYIEGARALVMAFRTLLKSDPTLELHFVGLRDENFENLPKNVTCHGYLDKTIKEDQYTYYNLIKKARVFVNTTPKWGSFSSSLEAMYYYTPVLITSYQEFVETFGDNFSGGKFCNQNELLADYIKDIFKDENYPMMCEAAHEAVKDFTWDNYITKFLVEAEKIQK